MIIEDNLDSRVAGSQPPDRHVAQPLAATKQERRPDLRSRTTSRHDRGWSVLQSESLIEPLRAVWSTSFEDYHGASASVSPLITNQEVETQMRADKKGCIRLARSHSHRIGHWPMSVRPTSAWHCQANGYGDARGRQKGDSAVSRCLVNADLLSPDPKRLRANASMVGCAHEMAPRPEVPVDHGMRGQEPLCVAARLEPLHLPLSSSRGWMRILGAVVQVLLFRCRTSGMMAR